MSAHVLLNLLNKLRKRDKIWGLPNILSLFHKEFNKFNNTRAQMLDLFIKWFLFDLILYVPSTIFQLNRDGSSWVEPVLS